MVDDSTIIEEVTTTKVDLPHKTQSILCSIRLHRFTRWSDPYSKTLKSASMFSADIQENDYLFQKRECKGCGIRHERLVSDGLR